MLYSNSHFSTLFNKILSDTFSYTTLFKVESIIYK